MLVSHQTILHTVPVRGVATSAFLWLLKSSHLFSQPWAYHNLCIVSVPAFNPQELGSLVNHGSIFSFLYHPTVMMGPLCTTQGTYCVPLIGPSKFNLNLTLLASVELTKILQCIVIDITVCKINLHDPRVKLQYLWLVSHQTSSCFAFGVIRKPKKIWSSWETLNSLDQHS
jgi:hypothetical protein